MGYPSALHFPVRVLFVGFLPARNIFEVRDNTIKVILSENQSCVCAWDGLGQGKCRSPWDSGFDCLAV